MKNLALLVALYSFTCFYAQVGINTSNPVSGAMLDIDSNNKGLLMTRVSLSGINDNTTITPSETTGLIVYNINTAGVGSNAVTPGFYYWNGSNWVRLQNLNNNWNTEGNNNITNGTHFLGTTNDRQIDFKTDNIDRLRIPGSSNQLLAMANGSNLNPFYSWDSDFETGLWRNADDQFSIGAARTEFITLTEAGTDEIVINDTGEDMVTRIKTTAEDNMFYVDNDDNRIGIMTDNPLTTFHIATDDATLRIDELNFTNNTHYISSDPMPVYVNTAGDLQLQPSLVQNFMAVNAVNFTGGVPFNASGRSGAQSGGTITNNLYNTSINLTQPSIVHVNYQISIQISNRDASLGYPVVDGAPRKYSAWVEVNGALTKIAFDTDMYTNMPDPDSGGGTYAAGYYYLAGSGSIQLPAGNHTFTFRGRTESGTGRTYYTIYGASPVELFQVIVQR